MLQQHFLQMQLQVKGIDVVISHKATIGNGLTLKLIYLELSQTQKSRCYQRFTILANGQVNTTLKLVESI
jgi:hypothetical protein